MAKHRSAGDLFFSVFFDKRIELDRGDGVTVGSWLPQFGCRAGIIHLRGGETVLASRLQGKHTQVIFVRASSQTRLVTADWQVRDIRTGVAFNVRDITPSDDRAWFDLLCESGVATG